MGVALMIGELFDVIISMKLPCYYHCLEITAPFLLSSWRSCEATYVIVIIMDSFIHCNNFLLLHVHVDNNV